MIPWKRGGARKRDNPEERFHIQVADYLRQALPASAFWTTIPTVGSSMLQGAKLKRKGYRAGTPDLVICYNGRAYWLELKAPNGRVAEAQRQASIEIMRAGCRTGLALGLDNVEAYLRHWAIPLRATLAPEPAQVKAARETA